MKNFKLTPSQMAELRFAHKAARNKSDAYKINVVILLGTEWTLKEVANALLIDGETARKYAHLYKICSFISRGWVGRFIRNTLLRWLLQTFNRTVRCSLS